MFSDFVPSEDIPFTLMFGNLFNPSLVDLEWPELEEYCCKLFQELQLSEDQIGFKNPSIRWGYDHENHAQLKYEEKHAKLHHNFTIKDTGFCVLLAHPFIGVSPDGLVDCNCCGQGVVEVKYSWCQQRQKIDENMSNLVKQNGNYTFNKSSNSRDISRVKKTTGIPESRFRNPNYYQMQTQIFVCYVEYCDFVVWTEKSLHIERIYKDFTLWNSIIEKTRKFFKFCILPELTAC
ncbi:uncharacterized protein LOC111619842 [Centruroides sculpturatus]|uniref:uncharacterized protein LOC111619842 n=1 Tax=Centruroides sculpturatus TaxID=218467 RepID=UPI000C6D7923|nr:uncharacterized protein LOC111619842 [Centruroides sculpturatus]